MARTDTPVAPKSPEQRARERAKYLTDVMWHAGTYVIINAMLWFIDIAGPGGVDWAHRVSLFWGIGLGFHVLAWIVEGRQIEDRMTRKYLEEERED